MAEEKRALVALGRTVRQVREERGMASSHLAVTAGIDVDLIAAIERGEHDPHYDVLIALADGLDITTAALFNRADTLSGGAVSPDRLADQEGGR